jgi:asparagine synthase (glutamine-hydrolysing)
MNGLGGILHFNQQPFDTAQLSQLSFNSPLWQPDHQETLVDHQYAIACTQRYIKPDDHRAPMPHQHKTSGLIVAGDLYLIERETLIAKLGLASHLSDIELVTEAYLKWDVDCVKHLSGNFLIAIWDKRKQRFFLATDHLGTRPCFYAHIPKKNFYFANTLEPIKKCHPNLSINNNFFQHFVLDHLPGAETCYKEVFKLPAAHYLVVNSSGLKLKRYWRLKDQKKKLPYKKREEYYEAFQDVFEKSVGDYLQSDHPISAHISGGLDSSSVASMAAHLLEKSNQSLYGFTAIPNGLEGDSFRKGWQYHEMPRVQNVLDQYPNIHHHQYFSQTDTDMLKELSTFYPYIDQPIRNVLNFDWILGSFKHATSIEARTLLTGQNGNGSISWEGQSLRQLAQNTRSNLKIKLKPRTLFNGYYDNFNNNFIQTRKAKHILHQRGIIINMHYWMLSQPLQWSRLSSIRPIELYYGINKQDSTAPISLLEFCYNVPQWVYQRDNETLNRRLLVREGLDSIVPEPVRKNPYRGEQAADWALQYNCHIQQWRKQLENISPEAAKMIWQLYDHQKMSDLLEHYPRIQSPDRATIKQIRAVLMRCFSTSQFYEYLATN